LDTITVTSFVLGVVAGVIVFALVLPSLTRRAKARQQAELEKYERLIADLRLERANDRETNRRLRHELAISTPQHLETTREERDSALEELDKLSAELQETTLELADRDRSLREARLAIHDIRVQLERDRFTAAAGADALADDRDADAPADDRDADGRALDPDTGEAADYDDEDWPAERTVDRHDAQPDDDDSAEIVDPADGDDDRASTVFFGEYPMGEATTP